MSKLTAIRGMNDILPDETPYWQFLEQTVGRVLASYGYGEIRLPVVEKTELFKRSIGEVTDIVEKEMYTFDDLSLIHISEPTRPAPLSRMPSSA